MSKIAEAFKNGKAIIPFITCGDPDLETTGKIIRAMAENGADLIEIGIPFSDPTAEGPIIQESNIRALSNKVTTDKVFDFVREIRKEVIIPMVFMAYANVVFSYGSEKFIKTCSQIGIDGIILPDLPFEEKDEFGLICKKYSIDLISLVAPASENRIAMIAKEATGFVYIIPSLSVTDDKGEIKSMVKLVKQNTTIPCAVGLGMSTEKPAKEVAELADGIILNSAIVKLVAKHGCESDQYVAEYVRSIKDAIR